ncbi:MAG: tRNA guanosine(34) transglycosylase Tgt [Planctomycetes bacterium]|nr:tRNA guanosine(34) transglycosylase Tgt [Planctomycetota bacterium]
MSDGFHYELRARCTTSRARLGTFHTPHGPVETPAFMPVGTRATVKGVLPRDLREVGARMILANTYHLHLRPGEEVVRELGGLHAMMAWDGPILTDSGGYQVFSMSELRSIDADGVTFKSVVDGSHVRFTPERVVDIQRALGADVMMAFDHCPSVPTDRREVSAATDTTHRWLERCVRRYRAAGGEAAGQALFGIVQGGAFEDLRAASVDAVCAHDLVGYAIGGVSVGEAEDLIRSTVACTTHRLPEDKPRYLMGVGTPRDFFDAVESGIDLFDCVTPTRNARNHTAFTSWGKVNVRNQGFLRDRGPLDPECDCVACTRYGLGTLRHLCTTREMLGGMLLSLHNLRFFHRLMERVRGAIVGEEGGLEALRGKVLERSERRVGVDERVEVWRG